MASTLRREFVDLIRLERGGRVSAAALDGLPAGEGRPVLLLPGIFATDRSMRELHRGLQALGYATARSEIGVNSRCGEVMLARVLARVEAVACDHNRPIALVGHSRG